MRLAEIGSVAMMQLATGTSRRRSQGLAASVYPFVATITSRAVILPRAVSISKPPFAGTMRSTAVSPWMVAPAPSATRSIPASSLAGCSPPMSMRT